MAFRYENLKLDKGMYRHAGQTFSQVLEEQDPSHQYKGTELEGLDAFQRQLKRFDIKVKGAGSDAVEKFFSPSEAPVLFPEYVSRSVRAGMEEGNILPSITASVTRFDGTYVRKEIRVQVVELHDVVFVVHFRKTIKARSAFQLQP